MNFVIGFWCNKNFTTASIIAAATTAASAAASAATTAAITTATITTATITITTATITTATITTAIHHVIWCQLTSVYKKVIKIVVHFSIKSWFRLI